MGARNQPISLPARSYAIGKELARQVFQEIMAAIDVRHAMLRRINLQEGTLVAGSASLPLARPPRVVALGKAANRMAATLDEILAGRIESGVVVSPAEPSHKLDGFKYFVGGHPYPNQGSWQGAEAAIELLAGLTPDDTVIYLISGGGSALFEKPLDPAISLADLVELNRILVGCGLPIEQINVVRKHLSAVKGGRLAAHAFPSRQLTIYISDVPEQCPSMVASGPTLADESTVEECYAIAEKNNLISKLPPSIRKHYEANSLEETPKPGDARFVACQYYCLLSNRDAVEAGVAAGEKLGFTTQVDPGVWDAPFREVVEAGLTRLGALRALHPGQTVCLVLGGEVICPVTGLGSGGRNQAFALYAAQKIAGQKRVVLSAGTDGRDGNSPASGAIADGQTIARAVALKLDADSYTRESDSYHFFCSLGDTLETGFTDNNVRDVRLLLDFGA